MLYFMNEIEKRRQDLLLRTRQLYNEKFTPPAIHPRFQTTYRVLYDSNKPMKRKYIWLRIMMTISIILALYFLYQQNISIKNINVESIINAIKTYLFSKILPLFIERFKFI